MARDFDLLVIGTGSSAKAVAYPCRAAGWSVAVVDDRPFGGTCANRGCDPKKVLVGVSSVFDAIQRLKPLGLQAPDVKIDWRALMAFKKTFTDPVPASTEKTLEAEGITLFHGAARFVASDAVEIGGERIGFRHAAICAGATPVPMGIPGEENLITSDDFLEMADLPPVMNFVGGGYIAFEFAHLAARCGSRVSIIHRGKRPLEHFEPELVDQLVADTRQLGITLKLETSVDHIPADGATWVHAAGRKPNLDHMDLPAAGVEVDKTGVVVDEYLRSTSNPNFYAAGDCSGSGAPQLTPVAGYEGRVVSKNLLAPGSESVSFTGVASVVFTTPPLASAGLVEAECRKRNLDFEVRTGDSSGWYSSKRIAQRSSGYKVILERGTEKILGAHLYGDSADEHINVFALAIQAGLTASTLKSTLFAYPTHGSDTQYML
ncbi:MAG: NAD(P)/FAD-dependent oxidoreductase [Bryobacteraceae bacterium]|nr:NAD(P)/FAD-dependent oxidoreductase [Bryobacteraceae bacterium]